MKYLKNLVICFGLVIGIIFVFTFLVTLLSYFNIMNDSVTTVFKMIIPILSMLASGIVMGRNSSQKGWLEGLKLGLMVCVLLMLFNMLGLGNGFKIGNVLFYTILTFSSIVGSMIGISRKVSNN